MREQPTGSRRRLGGGVSCESTEETQPVRGDVPGEGTGGAAFEHRGGAGELDGDLCHDGTLETEMQINLHSKPPKPISDTQCDNQTAQHPKTEPPDVELRNEQVQ